MKKEQNIPLNELVLQNIPNLLSVGRIILSFVVIYLIFTRASIGITIGVFVFAAITDWFDGQLARRFKWTSEFGRKIDIIADRFLWVGTALSVLIVFGIEGNLKIIHGVQLLLMMTREIITLPFALIAFFSGNVLPKARYIAKITTAIQGFALPAVILSTYHPLWMLLSIPTSLAAAVTGFYSAMYYMSDTKKQEGKNERTRRRKN